MTGLSGLLSFLLTNHQGLWRTYDPGYGNDRPPLGLKECLFSVWHPAIHN